MMLLTQREIQVITYVADGHRQSKIAEKMGISRFTVNAHLDKIREKLDAPTTANAVAIAFRQKIIEA